MPHTESEDSSTTAAATDGNGPTPSPACTDTTPPPSPRPPNCSSPTNTPDDRAHVAHTLHTIRTTGGAFSSRHRIIDTHGHTRSVVVVGDRVLDEHGEVIGSSGFYIDITDTIDTTVTEAVDDAVADLTASRGAIELAKGMLMLIYRIPRRPRLRRPRLALPTNERQTPRHRRRLLTRVAADLDVPPQRYAHTSIISCSTPPDTRCDAQRSVCSSWPRAPDHTDSEDSSPSSIASGVPAASVSDRAYRTAITWHRMPNIP